MRGGKATSIIIVCGECRHPMHEKQPFIICFECFSKGVESSTNEDMPDIGHKKDHGYYVMDKMDFPLFRKDSSVLEDFMLLKGISQSGIDNFWEISNNMELHTGPECESQFYTFFYKSRDQPLPNED